MDIIGIVLVKNEDRFIERVITNIAEFCDTIIVCDNMSTDRTNEIVTDVANRHKHIEINKIPSVKGSHDLLQKYAGKKNWIFGVDGDEIYDQTGLRRLKKRLHAGEFDRWWQIFGNVLNCTMIDEEKKIASGYLAPPSRSMTKLYNFFAINEWDNNHGERLHGGQPKFKNGYNAALRYSLYLEIPWEHSDFRCLHTCFTWRSSLDKQGSGTMVARPQPIETVGLRLKELLFRLLLRRQPVSKWKIEKYAKGDIVQKETADFFS